VAKLQGEVPADIDETDIDDGRALLEKRVKDMEQRFADVENIPLPPFWGGVRLVPESVEFWQGRSSRLHDRFRYVRVEGSGVGGDAQWRVQRLSP
jgi:pyridoxamine 5'-phosphate oxidase